MRLPSLSLSPGHSLAHYFQVVKIRNGVPSVIRTVLIALMEASAIMLLENASVHQVSWVLAVKKVRSPIWWDLLGRVPLFHGLSW